MDEFLGKKNQLAKIKLRKSRKFDLNNNINKITKMSSKQIHNQIILSLKFQKGDNFHAI